MSGLRDSDPRAPRDGIDVRDLASTAIANLIREPSEARRRRLENAAQTLFSAVLDPAPFEPSDFVRDILAFRISRNDLADHCIPAVARLMGEHWVSDAMTFAEVSAASARLFGVCKALGNDWDNQGAPQSCRSVLLVTMTGEQHLIGPALLTLKLRRNGHSVQVMPNAYRDDILLRLSVGDFDGLFISTATEDGLEEARRTIGSVRRSFPGHIPIILGGPAVEFCADLANSIGADLVTCSDEKGTNRLSDGVLHFVSGVRK